MRQHLGSNRCTFLWESQTLKLSPLNNTDPPTCSRKRGLSGALTLDPTAQSWDGDEGRWRGVHEGKAEDLGVGVGGGGMDCMRGYYHPSTAARWTADDFCSSKYSLGWGEEEEVEVERNKRRGKKRGDREREKTGISESFTFRLQIFLLLLTITCSPKPLICPKMSCHERKNLIMPHIVIMYTIM